MLCFSLTQPRRVLLARVPCRFLYPGHDEGSRVELSCLHCTLDNTHHFLGIGKREREKKIKSGIKIKTIHFIINTSFTIESNGSNGVLVAMKLVS